MIKQRIENIRDLMKEKNIYAYIVPSSDLSLENLCQVLQGHQGL